jgi:hypothetical protein
MIKGFISCNLTNIHKVSKSLAKHEMHETCLQNLKGNDHLGVE